MLNALVKVQARAALQAMYNRTALKKKKAKGNLVLMALLAVYILASLGFSFGFFFKNILDSFAPMNLLWLYFAITGLAGFLFSFMGSVFLSQSMLFKAKDNDLLLSLPLKPGQILLARTLSLYLMAMITQLVILLPAFIVFLLYGQAGAAQIVIFLLTLVLLPLPSMALSMLLGWLLSLVSDRIRHKNVITIVLSLGFLAAYFWGYSKLMEAMNSLVSRGQEIAKAVQSALPPAYHYGMSIAHGDLSSFLLFALFCLVPFGALMLIISRNYIHVLTNQRGARKAVYKGGRMRAGSPMKALVTKEARLFFGKPIYLMNSAISLLFMLALPLILLFDRNTLTAITATFGVGGDFLGPICALILCVLSASTFISAPSVSLEGKNLWLIQSLPVKPIQSLMAKALTHILISAVPIVLSSVLLAVILKLDLISFLLTLALPLAASAFAAFLGLALNLRFPKLSWRNEAEPVKQSMSTFLAMTLGFLVPAGLAALYIFALNHIPVQLYLLLSVLFFLLLGALLYAHLNRTADKAYLDLTEAA